MREEKLGKLLNELADMTTGTVRPGLAEDIKHQIPNKLTPHKGMDTINIMINLKVNKLAAALIIITMILSVSFLAGNTKDEGIYQDGKLMLRYYLAGDKSDRGNELAGMSKLYEYLVGQGKDVAYYGDSIDLKDSDAVLMQWKVADGKYKVILVNFGALSIETVSPEELVELQRRMLQKKTK